MSDQVHSEYPMQGSQLIKPDQNTSQQLTKFKDFDTIEEQTQYAAHLIKGGYIKWAKPETAVMVINRAREIGVGPVTALTQMFDVSGNLGMSVHLMTALAKKRGVDWSIEKDYEPICDANGAVVDAITVIRFYRFNTQLNKVIENVISYRYSDAQTAGYTKRDQWITKPRNMMRARCLAEGIRFVASDALSGIFYGQSELLDESGKDYEIDEKDRNF